MQTMVTVTELKAPETEETEKPKIRLAPYCRVSSPSEDQLHSFAAQIRHYVDTGVKIIIAVVVGGVLLAGLYALFNTTIIPTLTTKITEMFSYSGT